VQNRFLCPAELTFALRLIPSAALSLAQKRIPYDWSGMLKVSGSNQRNELAHSPLAHVTPNLL
jgi:hypothetical protein